MAWWLEQIKKAPFLKEICQRKRRIRNHRTQNFTHSDWFQFLWIDEWRSSLLNADGRTKKRDGKEDVALTETEVFQPFL